MKKPLNNENRLYIVAVGASAGGLEAIHEFFDHIPDSTDLAFIIIQHLSSDYKSLLVELVVKHTHMQVQEAQQGVLVQPGFVYVIPNNKVLSIKEGRLVLSNKENEKGPNQAIDTFMYSLAVDNGKGAIAVILSGTGSDGTKGAEAIKEKGGLIIVQDPASARFDGMPKSAIAACVADHVLAPAAMAEEIIYHYIDGYTDSPLTPEHAPTETVNAILDVVYKQTGYGFHQYKPATIIRRITRRLLQTKQGAFEQYEEFLKANKEESHYLAKEFFIGVTSFFRDKAAYESLYTHVFPGLIASKQNRGTLKIWVAACSTGQEAYSLAIWLDKFIQEQEKTIEVKIFASDIDEQAVEQASKGKYPPTSFGSVDEEIINTYFIRSAHEYTVIPRIRKQIVFAKHNLLKDPPFIKNDFISCRNLLIYLNPDLQKQVLSSFNSSLTKGGYLFLGSSENISPIRGDFEEIDGKWKLYKKRGHPVAITPPLVNYKPVDKSTDQSSMLPTAKPSGNLQLAEDFKRSLVEEFGFAAVYVNEAYEVKEVIGDYKRYLSLPDNIINLNILRMVPAEMSGILSTALRKVLKEGKKTTVKNIRAKIGESQRLFTITVQPPKATYSQHFILIIFNEATNNARSKTKTESVPFDQNQYIQEMEDELKETRHNLQKAVEGLETTNEELQSINEELQSANEELQSSNEELQSLNEELHTLNTEHQQRIKELVELNDDLNNYFSSTDIGQLFLDSGLNIRKFNPAAAKMINVVESDIGRPLSNIATNLKFVDLLADVEGVLQSRTSTEKEVELHNGIVCLMRILPYVRQDKKVDGLVITFIDVSMVKNLNSTINAVFDTSPNAILVFHAERNSNGKIIDFTCTAANYATTSLFHHTPDELISKSLKQYIPQLLEDIELSRYIATVEQNVSLTGEITINDEGGRRQWFDAFANKLQDGFILTLIDITHKKEASEKLRKNFNELHRTKESLRNLNNELEVKVSVRTRELAKSEERFRLVAAATNDAIWDWHFVSSEMWWSDSFFLLFGYDFENTAVKTATFWFDAIHPDDRERIRNSIDTLIHSNRTKWSEEYRFKKGDGSYARVYARASIMHDEYNAPCRLLGSMMDVTELQETEDKLKQKNNELQSLIQEFKFVTDFMPQMVWATQPNGYHDFFNKGWYDFTGLNFEQTRNKGWALVLHPDDYARTLAIWEESLHTGKPYEIEYRMRRHDGVYRWFLARALPLRNADYKIIKWFGTCTDIHDQKIMADVLEGRVKERTKELEAANLELESSNSELLQFASVASHDLKEPLRKIHMFGMIIKDRYLNEAIHEQAAHYLNRILASSSRMTNLINDLLTYSKLSVHTLFQPIDLNVVVQEVISDLELVILEKNATLTVDALPLIEAVSGQMRQVFQNLIFNALKFSKENINPIINIQCSLVENLHFDAQETDNGSFCRIKVIDNGVGFDSQYKHKVFIIFQQLHSKDKYDGTGIGLAITKKIIEKHGGIITVDSVPDEGTVFTMVLPLKQTLSN